MQKYICSFIVFFGILFKQLCMGIGMSNFDTAIITVLKHEGDQFVNDPRDPGGPTKFGISLRWLKLINPEADQNLIENLTQEEAISLYKSEFWDRFQYERIINQSIATKVLDACINMGNRNAHICLQRAVRAASGEKLLEDGIIGDKSLQAINNANSNELLAAYRSELAAYYRSVNNSRFIDGWLARAYSA